MEHLTLYEKFRKVPPEAQKSIGGGRLKGMTDINPMWRIKVLTEMFGPCGIGWYYDIKNKWVETAMAKDEITANVEIDLYYKWEGEWSKPVTGVGGSMLVAAEKGGLYVNDECYKMALTDAISVACKALGIGADIYWSKDTTKYNDTKRENFQKEQEAKTTIESELNAPASNAEKKAVMDLCKMMNYELKDLFSFIGHEDGTVFTKEKCGLAMKVLKEMGEKK